MSRKLNLMFAAALMAVAASLAAANAATVQLAQSWNIFRALNGAVPTRPGVRVRRRVGTTRFRTIESVTSSRHARLSPPYGPLRVQRHAQRFDGAVYRHLECADAHAADLRCF